MWTWGHRYRARRRYAMRGGETLSGRMRTAFGMQMLRSLDP
ncbi:hypothetical protein CDS [Bradyrhizobium sp.]|nr:hypothetical protein CDS [Bradyrhizobium sp.]